MFWIPAGLANPAGAAPRMLVVDWKTHDIIVMLRLIMIYFTMQKKN
jgi:hypothetical protein